MGTSTEGRRSGSGEDEGEEIIAWKFVPYHVKQDLIKHLNPDVPMSGNDWRMLASELGFTTNDINFIESEKENNTKLLLNNYGTRPGASVNEVYKALQKINREDCVKIICDSLPDIRKCQESNPSQSFHMGETQEMSGAHYQWSNTPYSCGYPPPFVPSMYGGPHSFCHHVVSCPGAKHGHHPMSCPSPYHPHSMSPHPHHSICQPCTPSPTHEKTCHPGTSLPSSHPHRSIGSASPVRHGNSPVSNQATPGSHAFPMSGHRAHGGPSYRGSPTYSYDDDDDQGNSMVVESDPQSMTCRPLPSQSLHHPTNPGLTNGGVVVEKEEIPASVPQVLLRQQGPPSFNDMPLPNNISAIDESNLHSTGSSTSESPGLRQKVSRQYSDECNVSQTFSGDKRFRHGSSGRRTGMAGEGQDYHGTGFLDVGGYGPNPSQQYLPGRGDERHTKPRSNQSPKFAHTGSSRGFDDARDRQYPKEVKLRNEPMPEGAVGGAPYIPRVPSDVRSKDTRTEPTSLAHLEKLANVPDKYKPTNEYKTVVAEQKIEAQKSNKGKDTLDCSSHSSSSSNGSSSSKTRPPNTFPMRVKDKHDRRVEDLASLTISKKSSSFPDNMKPKTYKKAFRHIKVFVTYSYDDEKHGKMVLSLCRWLTENGFACCVDVNEKKNTRSLEQMDWCRRKVREADFILLCISPKYLKDISSQPHASGNANERQLHTQEIYSLMNEDYLNGQTSDNSNAALSKFVPLLFSQMTSHDIPSWLKKSPTYKWPDQYKDLAWMLTKPQERIRAQRLGREMVASREEEDERRAGGRDSPMAVQMSQYSMDGVMCSS